MDSNGILNQFTVEDNEYADIVIEGNSLKIYPKKTGLSKIVFRRKKVLNNISLFYSDTFQDMITRGEVNSEDFTIDLKIIGVPFKFYKVDSENGVFVNNEYRSLLGTTFGLLKDGKQIDILRFDDSSETCYLDYGDYSLVEIKAGNGYKLNKEVINFSFNKGDNPSMIITNESLKGKIVIQKYKVGYDSKEVESNAKFEVYDMDSNLVGNITTDKNGKGSLELPFGKYRIVQKEGSSGYYFSKDFEVVLDEEKDFYYEIDNNIKTKIVIKKIDKDTLKPLENVCFGLYDSLGNLLNKGCTNKYGSLEFTNLDIGNYFIKEESVPLYYKDDLYKQEVLVNGEEKIINLVVNNERKKASLIIEKIDSSTGLGLKGVIFEIFDYNTNKKILEVESDKNGKIVLNNFFAGKYYIIEKRAPEGYILDTFKHVFDICDEDVKIVLTNEVLENPDTGDNIIGYFILLFLSLFSLSTIYISSKCRK